MNKETIIRKFIGEDKNKAINLYEKMIISYNRDIPMFGSEFYTPNIWKFFCDEEKINGLKVESEGVFEDSERRMICFNNNFYLPFPTALLKITVNTKFNKVFHNQYLGSILSLGLERNKIGDLIVKDNTCYVVVHEDIKDYIISNLIQIGKAKCNVEEVDKTTNEVTYNFENITINISSMRIDSVVAKLINKSRNIAQSMIDEGLVLVNYSTVRDKSFEVKREDRITIRKYGKYILGECTGYTKSGKCKIDIKKYT